MHGIESKDLRKDVRFADLQTEFEETAVCLFNHFQFDGLDPEAATLEVVGRFEKVVQSASGPVFGDDGLIPPLQVCTEAEVTRWFGFTDQRTKLLDRIRRWISLARSVKAKRLLLDGSFVTGKEMPGDVDAVVLLPDDFRDQLETGDSTAIELRDMLRTREPKELFAAEDDEDWWAWFRFFSRTRQADGRCKGLIEVAL
jgi:hypothetical protein